MGSTTVTIELSPKHYELLQDMACKAGKAPEALSREILEQVLQKTTAEIATERERLRALLHTAGRVANLSPRLKERIIPGVTLEEVRESLAHVGGKPLSEIIMEQRGPRS